MRNSKWLTDLKLRGSWGKTGFYGNTDPFNQWTLYGGTVSDAYYDIAGNSSTPVQGFRSVRIGDPKTGWQEDVVFNLGLESILWNRKLSMTVDWYKKKTSGLLFLFYYQTYWEMRNGQTSMSGMFKIPASIYY